MLVETAIGIGGRMAPKSGHFLRHRELEVPKLMCEVFVLQWDYR